MRFGATGWCGGDFAGFDPGFEFFGAFADFAELAFDGVVCCTCCVVRMEGMYIGDIYWCSHLGDIPWP